MGEVAKEGLQIVRLIHLSVVAVSATIAYLMFRAVSVPLALTDEAERLSIGASSDVAATQLEQLAPDQYIEIAEETRRLLASAIDHQVPYDLELSRALLASAAPQGRRELFELTSAQPFSPRLESNARVRAIMEVLEVASWLVDVPSEIHVDSRPRFNGHIALQAIDVDSAPADGRWRRARATFAQLERSGADGTHAARDGVPVQVAFTYRTSPRRVALGPAGVREQFPASSTALPELADVPLDRLRHAAHRAQANQIRDETPELVGVKIRAEDLAVVAPILLGVLLVYMLFHLHRVLKHAAGKPPFGPHEAQWIGCARDGFWSVVAFTSIVLLPTAAGALPIFVVQHGERWLAVLVALPLMSVAIACWGMARKLVAARAAPSYEELVADMVRDRDESLFREVTPAVPVPPQDAPADPSARGADIGPTPLTAERDLEPTPNAPVPSCGADETASVVVAPAGETAPPPMLAAEPASPGGVRDDEPERSVHTPEAESQPTDAKAPAQPSESQRSPGSE